MGREDLELGPGRVNGHHRNPVILAVATTLRSKDDADIGRFPPDPVYFIRDSATHELRPPTMHEAACLLWRCWRGTRARVPRGWRL